MEQGLETVTLRVRIPCPRHSLPEAIPDPRIPTKNYGNAFLRALPKCPAEVV